MASAADALDERAAENVVKATVEHFGRIDVVLLNAGGAPAIDMRIMNAACQALYADQLRCHRQLPVSCSRTDEKTKKRSCRS